MVNVTTPANRRVSKQCGDRRAVARSIALRMQPARSGLHSRRFREVWARDFPRSRMIRIKDAGCCHPKDACGARRIIVAVTGGCVLARFAQLHRAFRAPSGPAVRRCAGHGDAVEAVHARHGYRIAGDDDEALSVERVISSSKSPKRSASAPTTSGGDQSASRVTSAFATPGNGIERPPFVN
jgi:hypothetical protein